MFLEIPLHQMSFSGLVIAMGMLMDNAIVVIDEVERKLKEGRNLQESIIECCGFLFVPLVRIHPHHCLLLCSDRFDAGSTGNSLVLFCHFNYHGRHHLDWILAYGSACVRKLFVDWTCNQTQPFTQSVPSTRANVANRLGSNASLPSRGRPSHNRKYHRLLLARTFLEVQFFPPADRDQFQIQLELAANASMSETEALAREIRKNALDDPRIVEVHWFLGESAPAFYYNIVPTNQTCLTLLKTLVKCRSSKDATGATRHCKRL